MIKNTINTQIDSATFFDAPNLAPVAGLVYTPIFTVTLTSGQQVDVGERYNWGGNEFKKISYGDNSTKEDLSNKQTDLTPSLTKYPTVNAVNTGLESSKLSVIATAQPTPTLTGNTTNLNSTFKDSNGDTWIVDKLGNAIKAGTTVTLDGNHTNVPARTDSILDVEPTAIEVPAPINGDTATIFLANATKQLWNYTAGAWALINTELPAVVRTVGLTDGATINVNCDTTDLGYVTIAGNRTIANPAGTPSDDHKLRFRIKQDATGYRLITWGANYRFSGGVLPTLTSTPFKTDYLVFNYNSVDSKWDNTGFIPNF